MHDSYRHGVCTPTTVTAGRLLTVAYVYPSPWHASCLLPGCSTARCFCTFRTARRMPLERARMAASGRKFGTTRPSMQCPRLHPKVARRSAQLCTLCTLRQQEVRIRPESRTIVAAASNFGRAALCNLRQNRVGTPTATLLVGRIFRNGQTATADERTYAQRTRDTLTPTPTAHTHIRTCYSAALAYALDASNSPGKG